MEKKYDFKNAETELEKFWEEQGIYRYRNGKLQKA